MSSKEHPFQRWRKRRKLSYKDVAILCAGKGWPVSWEWIKQIAISWDRPSYDFSVFLSETITAGEVSVTEFMQAETKRKKAA